MPSSHKWNDRQLRYLDNLIKGMAPSEAYVAAGFKSRGDAIKANACKLAARPWFKEELENRRRKAAYKADVTQERLLTEEKAIAFSRIGDLFIDGQPCINPDQLPEHVQRAISSLKIITNQQGEVRYEYKFWDKGRSLERLGKHLGLFNDGAWVLNIEFIEYVIGIIPDDAARDKLKRSIIEAAAEQQKKA